MTGPLIPYHEALEMILASCSPLPAEPAPLERLMGRVLAEPLASMVDMPAFDNSAVDGYAVRAQDTLTGGSLELVGETRAGKGEPGQIGPGQAARVLTGAMMPKGADAVVMQEDGKLAGGRVAFAEAPVAGQNVRKRAEESSAGTCLLPAGSVLAPAGVALVASAGHASMPVRRMPKVAIIATGDELVEPGVPLELGQIYRSNGYGLRASVQAMGMAAALSHVGDDPAATTEACRRALEGAEVVLTSGGVSVGAHDHVKQAFQEAGVEERFWGVAIRPGQPLYFGIRGDKLVFGLPGNPVSSLVCFHMFVRPALLALVDLAPSPPKVARLLSPMRKKAGRLEFVRGTLVEKGPESWVEPIEGRGSHMLGGLASADSLIHFPLEAEAMESGAEVEATLLRASLA